MSDIIPCPALLAWPMNDWRRLNGRIPAAWSAILDADPELTRCRLVFDLLLGGTRGGMRLRVASTPLRSVSSLTGQDRSASGGMLSEPELAADLMLAEPAAAVRSVPFVFDSRLLGADGVAALVKRGIPLCGLVEVALEALPQADGAADYDARLTLLRGDLSGGVRFGAVKRDGLDSEPFDAAAADPKATCRSVIPAWVVSLERFADPHPQAVGMRIPVVLNGYQNIPALRVTNVALGGNDFVFAYGWGYTVSTATGVRVNGTIRPAAVAPYNWTLVEEVDETGLMISIIRFTAGKAWAEDETVQVTTTRPDRLGVLGVIERVLLDLSPLGRDGANPDLFSESAARLGVVAAADGGGGTLDVPAVLINGSGASDAAQVLEWIEGAFLPSYPMISMAWERGGYGPIVQDARLDPVAHLAIEVGGLLLSRTSLVEETPKDEIYNIFTYRYGYDPLSDAFAGVAQQGPATSAVCAASCEYFGPRELEPIESRYVTDAATAAWVLDWMAWHMAIPSYRVDYEATGAALLRLRRGDPVTISDADFGWTAERALVERIAYAAGRCTITLRVWVRFLDFGAEGASVM